METKNSRKTKYRQSADSDGGDCGDDGSIGCLMQLFKGVWWVITLPFRIVGSFFRLFDND